MGHFTVTKSTFSTWYFHLISGSFLLFRLLRCWLNFQEDLQVALSQGGRLLDCIKEPLRTDPEYSMTHDEVENLATVQR